jgi:hypothetical protein
MKCTYSLSVCAAILATAGLMPVYGGDVNSLSVRVSESRPQPAGSVVTRVIEQHSDSLAAKTDVVQKFNELFNSGKLKEAEALATDCFMENSADPFAVLMVRQVLLARRHTDRPVQYVRQRHNIVFRLKNSPAVDVATAVNDFLTSRRDLTQSGDGLVRPFEQIELEVIVVPDRTSNSLLISATPRYFNEIKELITSLDAATAPKTPVASGRLLLKSDSTDPFAANDDVAVWTRAQHAQARMDSIEEAVCCKKLLQTFPTSKYAKHAEARIRQLIGPVGPIAATCGPASPALAAAELSRIVNTPPKNEVHIDFVLAGVAGPMVSDLKGVCSADCLTPLNAAARPEVAGKKVTSAPSVKKPPAAIWPRLDFALTEPAPVDGVDFSFPNLSVGTLRAVKEPGSERMGVDIDFNFGVKPAQPLMPPQTAPGIFVPASQAEQGSNEEDIESTLSFHLIKGPMSTLDRLGIAIQGETPQISQPKLSAARDALPTPITVPVLTSVVEEQHSQVVPPLVEMAPKTVLNGEADVATAAYLHREKVIRHIGEPLATRRLSSEEYQEILKAAQAAPRVGLMNLPKLMMSNDQKMDLSSSVVDSAGKTLELGLHSYLTSDKRAINLRLDFHSEQGPAALSQRVTIREFLESEEALLIALDAPISSAGLETVADTERQTSYLVVRPKLRKPAPAKVAYNPASRDYSQRGYLRQIKSVRKSKYGPDDSDQKKRSNDFERRVYPVADLVTPIPDFVGAPNDKIESALAFSHVPGVVSKVNFQGLLDKITSTISPNEWEQAGGQGTIKPFETTLSLVIRATPATHDQIQKLIAGMRSELDVQAVLECRVIKGNPKKLAAAGIEVTRQDYLLTKAELDARTPDRKDSSVPVRAHASTAVSSAPFFEMMANETRSWHPCLSGLADALEPKCCPEMVVSVSKTVEVVPTISPKLLTSAQQAFLVKTFAENGAEVIYTPKMTIMNGQTGTVQSDGLSLSMKVVVGADRKTMDTTLSVNLVPEGGSKADSTSGFFQGRLIDGESILLPISECDEIDNDNVVKSEITYLLITPRVIVATEEVETLTHKNTAQSKSESAPVDPVFYVEDLGFPLNIKR